MGRRATLMMGVLAAVVACRQPLVDTGGTRPLAKDPHVPAPQVDKVAPLKGRPEGGAPTGEALAAARVLYQQRCALCHGASGAGDGIAAQNLRPSPQTLRDPTWQQATRDEAIAAIIVKGGAAVGKSLMMPASQDLAAQPEMVAALVAVVRGFAER